MSPDDTNLVEAADGCPLCAERRADFLVWDEEGTRVTCTMCGTTYTPPTPPRPPTPSTRD